MFKHLFMCLLAICMSSLEKCLFRSYSVFDWVFFVLMLSCETSFYILEIKPLSVSFANSFSPSLQVVFLLMVSFALQKFVSLIRSCLFLLSCLLPWETDLRKHWYDLCQRCFAYVFVQELYGVLSYISLRHFDFLCML